MTFGYFDVAPSGTISIEASTGFAYTGTYIPSFVVQSAVKYFAQNASDRFRVVDTLGTDPGYSTTIQLA
ncbi:hypothetical protein KBC03_07300 [Patescibacteria group bacterium]|nr:hypothetical protein [Patescibacteria group bacterium]